jgi:glyoxylase-like metal-dependent hydrolase (beta-lactamase superfamily II)
VLIVSIKTGLWDETCWLLAAAEPGPALVVDPGLGAARAITQLCQERDLTVAAVLATHGHIDHIADAAIVANQWQVPVYIHPLDRELLLDPSLSLGPGTGDMLEAWLGRRYLDEPEQIVEIADRQVLELAGLSVTVLHTPGHRPGCVIYRLATDDALLAFTGDTLFAGTIGRTDLPGSSPAQMTASLRDVVLGHEIIVGPDGATTPPPNLPDEAVVLPGHGPQTTMAQERAQNQFLQANFLRQV